MSSSGLGGHDAAEGLTGAQLHVHFVATPDEEIQVQTDAFLDALADVAIHVAKRLVESGGAGEAA